MTQLASDNFTRANGALGANWTDNAANAGAAWAIVSNAASATPPATIAAIASYSALAAPNDGYAEATIGASVEAATDQGCGPCYRASRTVFTCYFVQGNSNETRLYKVVAASFTKLGSDGPPITTGDVLRITCTGTSLVVTKNGTSIITATDSALTSGDAGIFDAPSSGTNTLSLFAFGDTGGGGSSTASIAWVV